MKITDWEYKEISTIVIKTYNFFLSNGYVISSIKKNSRDGGYVTYDNRKKMIKITFFFLPNYDVEIYRYAGDLLLFLKSIFNKDKIESHIFLKANLKSDYSNKDLVLFMDDALNYIKDINLY